MSQARFVEQTRRLLQKLTNISVGVSSQYNQLDFEKTQEWTLEIVTPLATFGDDVWEVALRLSRNVPSVTIPSPEEDLGGRGGARGGSRGWRDPGGQPPPLLGDPLTS